MIIKALITILLFGMVSSNCLAQIKGLSAVEPEQLFKTDMMDQMSSTSADDLKSIPIGNPVKPEHYKVGPGDVLAIQNLAISPNMKMAVITPESSVLLPRVGEVTLEGLTLIEAKAKIIEAITTWNSNAVSFVTLYKPRTVLITVAGNTQFNGSYTLPASYTVSMALNIVTKPKNSSVMPLIQSNAILLYEDKIKNTRDLKAGSGLPDFKDFSSRNVSILHNDGTTVHADFLKAKAMNSVVYDPYISDGDMIYVPYDQQEFDFISIAGEVVYPAVIPFKIGDDANLLFKIGFGLTEKADENNIYLVNTNGSRQKLELDGSRTSLVGDYEVEPGSMIVVGKKVEIRNITQGVVAVSGQVGAPGVFIIKMGETRLKDIINMAGGFTDKAYLPLGRVVRSKKNTPFSVNVDKQYNANLQYSDLSYLDSVRYKVDVNLRNNMVSCNVHAAFNGSDEDNILLENGDLIYIPSKPSGIFVYGQVLEPGFIPFVEGKTMDWYIERVGGYGSGADISRARIIRGKDRVWIEPGDDVFIMAGDEIYAPRDKEYPAGTEIQMYSAIASITSAAVFLIATMFQIFK
jgi:polysaccharide biosynthesis/export protein